MPVVSEPPMLKELPRGIAKKAPCAYNCFLKGLEYLNDASDALEVANELFDTISEQTDGEFHDQGTMLKNTITS
jgi:hypothetical protein